MIKKTISTGQVRAEREPIINISLRGARQHNLKNLDLDFPIGKLTVVCGVSGSGKTTLALNTLYAEGQRRYIESFSAYTRQFLQRIDKPSFDSLVHLPPSIAITRELRSRNNRSTVGTASEMLEYLRVVFANRAELSCYQCHRKVESHNPKTVADYLSRYSGQRAIFCFELGWQNKSNLSELLFDLQSSGFIRLIASGKTIHLADDDRKELAGLLDESGQALVVVDRLKLGNAQELDRMVQSLATAFDHRDDVGSGKAIVLVQTADGFDSTATDFPLERIVVDGVEFSIHRFATSLRCEHCRIDYPASEPRLFNFNSPVGACSICEGFGETVSIDMKKVIPDESLSLNEGAIAVWRTPAYSHELDELRSLSAEYTIPFDVPVSKLKPKQWRWIQEGVPERAFGGLNGFFAWLERKKYKMHVRAFLARWRTYSSCQACKGQRLNREALAYELCGKSFAQLCDFTIDDLWQLLSAELDDGLRSSSLRASGENSLQENRSTNFMLAAENRSRYVASEPQRQVLSRIEYLQKVGLGYLALARPLHTLSGGESQRVMMTTLLGSSLVDMLYVFDEPTVGLHPQDTERMASAILGLRDRGNTVVLVEHEPHLMRIADRIIEIGPQAGDLGGRVTFEGTPSELVQSDCLTGEYLSGARLTERTAKSIGENWFGVRGASGRNLKVDELRIPTNCLTVVMGPSGSGKSSLILDTLCPAIERAFDSQADSGLPFESLFGMEFLTGCLAIDQSPIQRSMRSSPVTYSKAMDDIRQVFADTPDAKARGFGAGHFSFNSNLGRCATCEGLGYTTIDMQFMADVQLPCQDCDGKRFRADVLEVRYRDMTIAEVLEMSIDRALSFFRGSVKVQERLKPLIEIGLGYLPLGQSLATLSAGESMRLKLASHLDLRSRKSESNPKSNVKPGKLIVLDEPTTGLHFSDVQRLLICIDAIIDSGNSVVVIEHNSQMICAADYLIEVGPEAGPHGGKIIAEGTFESIRANPLSITAPYL